MNSSIIYKNIINIVIKTRDIKTGIQVLQGKRSEE